MVLFKFSAKIRSQRTFFIACNSAITSLCPAPTHLTYKVHWVIPQNKEETKQRQNNQAKNNKEAFYTYFLSEDLYYMVTTTVKPYNEFLYRSSNSICCCRSNICYCVPWSHLLLLFFIFFICTYCFSGEMLHFTIILIFFFNYFEYIELFYNTD